MKMGAVGHAACAGKSNQVIGSHLLPFSDQDF